MKCDRCGEEVPTENSSINLADIRQGGFGGFFATDRHIYPTDTCTGSPSRREYLKNNPQILQKLKEKNV